MLSSCIPNTTIVHPSLFDFDVIPHLLPRIIIYYLINSLLPIVQLLRRHCGMFSLFGGRKLIPYIYVADEYVKRAMADSQNGSPSARVLGGDLPTKPMQINLSQNITY
jgi:hypothetical protein